MAKGIKGIILEIGGDTSALQKSLKDVNSKSSSLSKELKGINTLLKLDPKNTELLTQKQTVLNSALEENNKKLKELEKIEAEARKKGIDKSDEQKENLRALQREIVSTQNKIKNITSELNNFGKEKVSVEKVGKSFEEIGKKIEDVGDKVTKTVSLPNIAIATLVTKTASDVDTAISKYISSVGISKNETEKYKEVLENIYKGNYGENFEDIANSMISVKQQFKEIDNNELEEMTKNALAFRDIYGDEVSETIRSVKALIDNFGISSKQAFNILVQGEQQGLNYSGELLDNINEYSVQFKKLGFKVEDMFGIFKSGAESGAFNLDKIGDAVKEFSIRAIDGSKTTIDGYKKLGLNADIMAKKFAEGGEEAKKAFVEIVKKIAAMDDKVKQSEVGVNLFGTMWEDLGGDVISAFSNMEKGFDSSFNSMENSANSLYDNTVNKAKTTMRKLTELAVKLGDKLIPIVDKVVDKIDIFVDGLDKLDDKQIENILRIGGMVTAIGPLIKIVGKGTNVVGKISNGFGIFSKALKVSKGEITSNEKSINILSKAFNTLKSPVGIAAGTIAAITLSIAMLTKKTREEMEVIDEANKKINDSVSARNSALDSIKNNMQANLSEIDNVKVLNSELKTLVDENGKVKDGYKDRANFILNELNKALGTEYSLNGDIINSYKDMQNEIDKTIKKKEAQLILEANEEQYKEAIKNKTKALEERAETYNKILELGKKIQDSENNKNGIMDLGVFERNAMIDEYNELVKTYENLGGQLESYNGSIEKYQANQELFLTGTDEAYKKIADSVSRTNTDINANVKGSLSERLQMQAEALEKDKEIYEQEKETNKNAKDSIYAKNIEESQKNLELTKNTLIEMTGTAENMTPEVAEAWKTLANSSNTEYSNTLSKLPLETQEKIKNVVGVIDKDSTVSKSAGTLGDNLANAFTKGASATELGKNIVAGIQKGINNTQAQSDVFGTITGFGSKILGCFKGALGIHSPSKITTQDGIYLLQGMSRGIIKGTPEAIKSAKIASNKILNSFEGNFNISSNLIKDMPNLQNSLHTSLNASISPKIFTPNIVINTQHLDTQELDRIVNYINNRFGDNI